MKGAQSMKTNEELAMMIQNGDESKVPELWERMHKLYLKKSIHYFDGHRELCSRCGVELDDIQQQAFFAFLQSVEAYNPESGLSFLAFINYPFQTEMQNLTGTRTALTRLDPLNSCASLDKEIDTEDGNGDTLGDFVPDLTALDFLELLDAESVGAMVRAEVRKLSAPVCDVIESYYFNGQTLGTIAEQLGLSLERVRQLRKRGEVTLSKRRVLVDLWNEYHHTEQQRQLESAARHADNIEARRVYERQAAPKPQTWLDLAFRYAADKRERSGKSSAEWSTAEQTAAVLEYLELHPEPVTA
jgi:RNA polymerase sigma factor (sigma-70 family)